MSSSVMKHQATNYPEPNPLALTQVRLTLAEVGNDGAREFCDVVSIFDQLYSLLLINEID